MAPRYRRSTPRFAAASAVVLVAIALVASAPRPCSANIYNVTTTSDSGAGSFRKAINDANGHAGTDEIRFALGADKTIKPLSALPAIIGKVDINGTSQPGYAGTPIVEIDGELAGTSGGLYIVADGVTVRGLVINRFSGRAIEVNAAQVRIAGNYIGTDVTGSIDLGNGEGIQLDAGDFHTVGGLASAERNVISGNAGGGIAISGGNLAAVINNFIGTNAAGTAALGNGGYGVRSFGTSTYVGVGLPGGGNVISGNYRGVEVSGTQSYVVGNTIGLDRTGSVALPNSTGVEVGGAGSVVGAASVTGRNVISANTGAGIVLRSDASNCFVIGNRIGTNPAGTAAFGNGGGGLIVFSDDNTIGGALPDEGNLVSGNAYTGIDIDDQASGNELFGNTIGLNAAGTAKLPNQGGLRSYGSDTVIGKPGAPNVISGNDYNGVVLGETATGCTIASNRIGTSRDGTVALGNASTAIVVYGDGNTIGGPLPADGNLISGNGGTGIDIANTASENVVLGNTIGLNAAGTAKLANSGGVRVYGPSNTIGAPGAGNVISGNAYSGLVLYGHYDSEPNGNVVQANKIGTGPDGTTPFGNAEVGVYVVNAYDNVIGGTNAGAENIIANNGLYGVFVDSGDGNAVLGNSIFANAFWGIDHAPYGVSLNDAGDVDFGPNHGQNYPVVTSVLVGGGQTEISGVLDSLPATSYRVELFSNPACDPSGFGEGKTFLIAANVATNAAGHGTFDVIVPTEIADDFVTATATSEPDGTSEFSPCALAIGPNPGTLQFSQSQFVGYETEPDGKVEITVTRSGGSAGSVTVHYASASQGAAPGVDYTEVDGTLTFAAGEVAKIFQVPVAFDLAAEGQENIGLVLSAPTGGATLGAQSTSKIALIDYSPALPTAYVSDAQVVEGDAGTKTMSFTITVTAANQPITVYYQTTQGSALPGVDYEHVNDQIVFNPGDPPKTVSVQVYGDDLVEGTEVFYLLITGVFDGTLTDGLGEGLIFDDDTSGSSSVCANGTTIAVPRIAISGLGDQPGNERLSFKGRLKFPAGAPAGMTPLDALGHGAQILIEDLGAGGTALFDLTAATDPVPPGAPAASCAPGQLDGWTVNAAATIYTYKNASGALAPSCAADSAHGLKLLKLTDRRAQRQKVFFNVRSKLTTIATPVGPLRGTIVLGADAADGLAGRCGSHAFGALACDYDATGKKIVCQ